MSDPIKLPSFPTDTEFEEFIAAQFQVSGYFLERNIIERGDAEVLELDIVLTDYSNSIPQTKLIEVKSGKWGFSELFKLKGWLVYLKIENGQLIIKKEPDEFEFMKNKAEELGIDLTLTEGDANNPELVEIEDVDSHEITSWRYAYWIERELIKFLKNEKKNDREKTCYKAASDYYQHLSGGIYFYDTVAEKLVNLYDWHYENPYLSASTSNELTTGEYSDANGISGNHYRSTFYECEINVFQCTSMVEYLAKLQILKYAVDYNLLVENDLTELADKVEFRLGDIEFKKSSSLPNSFHEGLDYLSQSNDYKKYPILWSYFIYLFGGFILKEFSDQEYEILTNRTGVSRENIEHALQAFNVFFPNDNDWFFENGYIKGLKMFPAPLRGVGAYYKNLKYTEEEEGFTDLGSGDYHTINDLVRWNNCSYFLLKGEY